MRRSCTDKHLDKIITISEEFLDHLDTLIQMETGILKEDLAAEVYKLLRENVVNNVLRQYARTGYIWEQYNDKTGEGQGCKPFTGGTLFS